MYVHVDQDTPTTASQFAAAAARDEERRASSDPADPVDDNDNNDNNDNVITDNHSISSNTGQRAGNGRTAGPSGTSASSVLTTSSDVDTHARQLEAANREARSTLAYRGMHKVDGWQRAVVDVADVGETVPGRVGRAYRNAGLRGGDGDGVVGERRVGMGGEKGRGQGRGTEEEPFVVED